MKLHCRYIIIITTLLINTRGFSQFEKEHIDSMTYLEYNSYLNEKPYFEQGKEALINWFNDNINYPPLFSEHHLQVNFYFKAIVDTIFVSRSLFIIFVYSIT